MKIKFNNGYIVEIDNTDKLSKKELVIRARDAINAIEKYKNKITDGDITNASQLADVLEIVAFKLDKETLANVFSPDSLDFNRMKIVPNDINYAIAVPYNGSEAINSKILKNAYNQKFKEFKNTYRDNIIKLVTDVDYDGNNIRFIFGKKGDKYIDDKLAEQNLTDRELSKLDIKEDLSNIEEVFDAYYKIYNFDELSDIGGPDGTDYFVEGDKNNQKVYVAVNGNPDSNLLEYVLNYLYSDVKARRIKNIDKTMRNGKTYLVIDTYGLDDKSVPVYNGFETLYNAAHKYPTLLEYLQQVVDNDMFSEDDIYGDNKNLKFIDIQRMHFDIKTGESESGYDTIGSIPIKDLIGYGKGNIKENNYVVNHEDNIVDINSSDLRKNMVIYIYPDWIKDIVKEDGKYYIPKEIMEEKGLIDDSIKKLIKYKDYKKINK